MKDSSNLFFKLLANPISSWIPWVMLVVSTLGFFDASYLAAEHFAGTVPPCNLFSGCEIVTTSKYALMFGVPVALLGAIYYAAIFFLTLLYLDTKRDLFIILAATLTFAGFGFSLWFLLVQAFILNAYCQYCLFSALTSTILFVLGLLILRVKIKFVNQNEQSTDENNSISSRL